MAGPPAGGDDRGDGRQDGTLLGALPQRHVHENHQTQPLVVGLEDFGDARGNESVEEYDGRVRYPRQQIRQRGARRRIRGGPGACHWVLVHEPTERGKSVAHPAVVGVAAARPERIVDVVRDDHVHRAHSGRS